MSESEIVFEPLKALTAQAAYLPGANMDTDQIIPGRFLKKNRAQGYGQFLFFDARFDEQERARPDHPLNAENRPQVLLVDDNFGCGSSREGAVYALADFGVRVVIGTSFGDIFFSNCSKNGVLAICLSQSEHHALRQALTVPCVLHIDLNDQSISHGDNKIFFEVDPFAKTCLMRGVDELALTLSHQAEIDSFEKSYQLRFPWLTTKRL